MATATATLYHGTTSVFGSFSLDPPRRRDSGNLGRGVYLTDDVERAMLYAEANVKLWGGVPTVLEVEADLGNVAVLDRDLMDHLRREAGITFPPEVWDHERSERLRWWFLDHGYDSVENSTLATEVCVFDPARLRIVGQVPYVSSRDRLIRAYEEKIGKPWPGKRNPGPKLFPEQEARRRAHEIYRKARRRMLSLFKRGVRKKLSKDPKRPLLHFCVEVSGLMLAYAKLAGYEAHVVSVWLDDEDDGYYHDVIVFDVDGWDEWFDPTGFAGLGEVSDWRSGMELDWVSDDEALVKAEHLFTPAMRKALITPAIKARYGLSKNPPLALAVLDHQGRHFETGVPVTFRFVRNTAPSPYMGERFQQHIEPAGRYMTHVENPRLPVDPSGRMVFETGLITFRSPIVLLGSTDDQGYGPNSWKARLADHYQATGLELSKAILKDGHDGIVTVSSARGEPYTSEIVDLGVIPVDDPATQV